MIGFDEIVASGQTAAGTNLITPDDLEVSLLHIRNNGPYVSSMESYIIDCEKEIATFDFCLLGIDRREDLCTSYNSNVSFDIVLELIQAAKISHRRLCFRFG